MPQTLSINRGDGITTVKVQAQVVLGDTTATVAVSGTIQAPNQPAVTITPTTLTVPTATAPNALIWQIQVNYITGAAVVVSGNQTSNTAGGGMTMPLLLGELMPQVGGAGALPNGSDPPAFQRGVELPLLLGGLTPTRHNAPVGRASVPADQSNYTILFRSTRTPNDPAAMWANGTNQALGA